MRATFRPILIDSVLAVAVTILIVAGMPDSQWAHAPAVALALLSTAPIVARRYAPVASMAVIGAALAVYLLLGYPSFPTFGAGLLISMFTVARHRPMRVAAAAWVLTLPVAMLSNVPSAGSLNWLESLDAVLETLIAWILGDSSRRWAKRSELLAEKAARIAAEERERIARELHDIVAHHMAVISLQSGVATYVLDTDMPTARTALAAVNDSGRQALAEMRRLLELLRVDTEDMPDHNPQPGLAQLCDLVDRIRAAGLPVELTVAGEPRALSSGPDLCAYRVAQEALTNVLKHAGPATAQVELTYGTHTVTLRVTDDGTGPKKRADSVAAHGIIGMRERAELYGGVLAAGPRERGGFAVLLRLPMNGDR
ncbi:histidine kinase [Nocardia sp. NPDC051570]|uniref:histidine kinase n=1 Tax=Nocardia sp. NPDC051570 TaxID=3364324 RepID=UPI0037888BE9